MGMGKSCSVDLRLRVLSAVDDGMSKMAAHQMFQVSRSTIDDWLKLRAETGAGLVGCALLPLPPLSPDLNKIEPLWHTIKTRIAHQRLLSNLPRGGRCCLPVA
jgi:hypothetical protein